MWDLGLEILLLCKTQKVPCKGLREIKMRMGRIYIKILFNFFVEMHIEKSTKIKSVQLNEFP